LPFGISITHVEPKTNMQTHNSPICPECQSSNVTWRAKAGEWDCQSCHKRFFAPPPSAENIPDPLASIEDDFARRAKTLADSGLWVNKICDEWPAPIATTYALLRTTLRKGQIDASALIFKDFVELLARFSALALACEILEHPHATYKLKQDVYTQLFSKHLSMGDWVKMAYDWARLVESETQDKQDWMTRPIAQMWANKTKKSTNSTKLYNLVSQKITKWRNDTIGHGVRGGSPDTTMMELECQSASKIDPPSASNFDQGIRLISCVV